MRHGGLLASVASLGVGAAAASILFVAGSQPSDDGAQLQQALRKLTPTVRATTGRIRVVETYSGRTQRTRGQDITLGAAKDAGLVTSVAIRPQQTIGTGHVVGAIQGSPVLILQGRLPGYRSLRAGMSGPDVDQLHSAMVRQLRLPCRCSLTITKREIASLRSFVFGSAQAGIDRQAWDREVPVTGVAWFGSLPSRVEDVKWRPARPATRTIATTLAGTGRLRVRDVPAESRVKVGTPATAQDADGTFWRTRVAGVSSGKGGLRTVTLSGDPPRSLRSVNEVRLVTVSRPGRALIVPTSAVATSADGVDRLPVVRSGRIVPLRIMVIADLDGRLAVRAPGLRAAEDIAISRQVP